MKSILCSLKRLFYRGMSLVISDSLFFNLVVNNISRSGAVANMTCDEYRNGNISPTGQYVVLVKKHKTARKYGPCQIVIKADVKQYCDIYFNIIRKACTW